MISTSRSRRNRGQLEVNEGSNARCGEHEEDLVKLLYYFSRHEYYARLMRWLYGMMKGHRVEDRLRAIFGVGREQKRQCGANDIRPPRD